MRWIKRSLQITLILGLPISFQVWSESYYEKSIQPTGIETAIDFKNRFGEPTSVGCVQQNGVTYYKLSGHLPPWYIFVLPSSLPEYIFNDQGRLVAWCPDPADSDLFLKKWSGERAEKMDVKVFEQKFAVVAK